MRALLLICLFLVAGCPTGGTDNCSSSWSCSGGACRCDDDTACEDPAGTEDDDPASCVQVCEVCEELAG